MEVEAESPFDANGVFLMNKQTRLVLSLIFIALLTAPCSAEQSLGTNMGIPQSSPGILWPRGMSLEALSPENLYPNGPQFGLSNTSGGFGMTGSGPMSGVGLAQRSVSPLAQEEFRRPYSYIKRLTAMETLEATRSASLLYTTLGSPSRFSTSRISVIDEAGGSGYASRSSALQTTDSILQDRPATTDSILHSGL